ncbi:hypothetical protein D3C85_425100 [compost metagenome]
MPERSHATPFNKACSAVEQVIEWEISGPELCKSCATQEEIFPKVVVGEAKVWAFPVSKYSWWCFSNKSVAPRDEPILIPKISFGVQAAVCIAFRDAAKAYKTDLSRNLYLLSDCCIVSTICFESSSKGATTVFLLSKKSS